jgi:TetR/AcrR family transcriptional regulator, transcriptional repressor for nem operon
MDTRTALLNAAEHAVRARGYDGFSYADLATAVGIRKASIHHHFPTKADLALVLIERYCTNFFATLEQITASNSTAGKQLAAYIAVCRAALSGGDELCLCVAFCTGRDHLTAAVLAKLDDYHVVSVRWLAAVFTTGKADGSITGIVNADDEAHGCLAQMEGAQLVARAAKDVHRFDLAVAVLRSRIS